MSSRTSLLLRRRPPDPVGDRLRGDLRSLEVGAVAGTVDDDDLRSRHERHETFAERAELLVLLGRRRRGPDTRWRPGRPRAAPACPCRSNAGSRPDLRRCCAGGPGAWSFEGVSPREQRGGEPLVDECLDTDLLDVVGERLVGAPSVRSLRGVVDAGRRTDQHQSFDGVGMASAACSPTRPPIE